MSRTVTKTGGMTFSNGVYLPYGTMISVPQRVIHDDLGKQPSDILSRYEILAHSIENYPDGELNGYR